MARAERSEKRAMTMKFRFYKWTMILLLLFLLTMLTLVAYSGSVSWMGDAYQSILGFILG